MDRIDGRDAVRVVCPRCGTFDIEALAPAYIDSVLADARHQLAYAVRAASDRKERLFLTVDNALEISKTAPTYSTLGEAVDLLLLQLASRARRYMEQIDLRPSLDYTRVPTKDEAEYMDLFGLAAAMGFVDQDARRITVDGWRRVESLRTVSRDRRQAFVAMWFDASMNDAWRRGFEPGIARSKYFRPFRIDGKEHNNKIDDEIVAEVRRSGLLVADFTGQRGGVYFEAGFAQGLGVPVIWTCREDHVKDVHFDTRQYSHIVWDTPESLADALDRRIRATVVPIGYIGTD